MSVISFDQPVMKNGDNARVDTPSVAFALQHNDCQPCHDLMGGTEVMRRASTKYLPQRTAESKETYEMRVQEAVLENIFAQTIAYNKGQVFSRNVIIDDVDNLFDDETLSRFNAWAEDCDRQGQNLTSWASKVFAEGLIDGVTFVLVDFPHINERDNNGIREYQGKDGAWRIRNAQAERQEGWAPYLVHIDARQVLDCRSEMRGGRRVITHFRYLEKHMENHPDNPWGEVSVNYVRCYWLDHWEVWRKVEGEQDYTLYQAGRMSLAEIPLAVFMAGEERSPYTARPALMDLAWLNIRHWQTVSGHYNLMGFNQNPVWAIVGITDTLDENGNPKRYHSRQVMCCICRTVAMSCLLASILAACRLRVKS